MHSLRRALAGLPFLVGGIALLIGFEFGGRADSPGNSLPIIQNGGATKGAAAIINCDGSSVTCTLAGGKVTLAAVAGSGGITQLTTDVTAGPGSGSQVATVVQIEGAAIPASATVIGTNSSKQLTAPTAATVTAYLNQFTSLLQGLVPPSGGSSTSLFLNEAGTFTSAAPSANSLIRSIGGGFDGGGSALTSGASSTAYFTVPFACTIAAWNATVDTGTITFDVWKIATGTAIPTVANTITAAALPAIASGTALHSITITGWTTAVSANDIFGVNINTVSSATKASLVLQCNAS